MERFVEYKKKSKKARKEADAAKRLVWNMSPVSRVVESKKIYKRSNNKQIDWSFM